MNKNKTKNEMKGERAHKDCRDGPRAPLRARGSRNLILLETRVGGRNKLIILLGVPPSY